MAAPPSRQQRGGLSATLGELAQVRALSPQADAPTHEGDAIAPFEVPTDRFVTTTDRVAEQADAARAAALNVAGVSGSASGLVLRALARRLAPSKRKIVAVTADVESARALAADASFMLGARDADDAEAAGATTFGQVLLYLPNDASPYADVNPDRRGAQTRLATLFHIAIDLPWSVLVCPIGALARKVVPKDDVLEHAELIVAGQEIDRAALVARLSAAGYVRSPLVEDPGSFAVRGALLDVWAPCATDPVRIEFYGDLVMSIRAFDPDGSGPSARRPRFGSRPRAKRS